MSPKPSATGIQLTIRRDITNMECLPEEGYKPCIRHPDTWDPHQRHEPPKWKPMRLISRKPKVLWEMENLIIRGSHTDPFTPGPSIKAVI